MRREREETEICVGKRKELRRQEGEDSEGKSKRREEERRSKQKG